MKKNNNSIWKYSACCIWKSSQLSRVTFEKCRNQIADHANTIFHSYFFPGTKLIWESKAFVYRLLLIPLLALSTSIISALRDNIFFFFFTFQDFCLLKLNKLKASNNWLKLHLESFFPSIFKHLLIVIQAHSLLSACIRFIFYFFIFLLMLALPYWIKSTFHFSSSGSALPGLHLRPGYSEIWL